jgi:hypothetical protein
LPGTLRLYDGAETGRMAGGDDYDDDGVFFSETRFPFLSLMSTSWVGVVGYLGTLLCVHKVLLGT